MSKNQVSIEQLKLCCGHVVELTKAGVSENLAIRTLELVVDVYAKLHKGGAATPHHIRDVELWSLEARRLRGRLDPSFRPKDYFIVEHGTPRRTFARLVLKLYQEDQLSGCKLNDLIATRWELAVVTLEEDKRLNGLKTNEYCSPRDRWADAGICFDKD